MLPEKLHTGNASPSAKIARNHAICDGPHIVARVHGGGYPIGEGWSQHTEDLAEAICHRWNVHADMLDFIKQMANFTTPEDEFEDRKGEDGTVYDDGVTYHDADEMLADISDDRLMDEFSAFCDMIRAARKIRDKAEGRSNG